MKPTLDLHGTNSPGKHRTGGIRAALILGMAMSAWSVAPGPLIAEVLDDFEDATKFQQVWETGCINGTCGQVLANGQVRLSVTPSGDHGFSILRTVRRWTPQEGRTLEFRVDLVSSSGDGAMIRFGWGLGDGTRNYGLFVDQDTLVLGKRDNPIVQSFVVRNGLAIKVDNVKLVLSITGIGSGLRLQYKILDNDPSGAVIQQGEVWDTPKADPMQKATDDPPGSYLGLSGLLFLSVYHDNARLFDPTVGIGHYEKAEVVCDNVEVFEYDADTLDIENAVCLTWPENTAEEQVVVGASSLEGPWTPWPEPIYQRQGALCMTVPTATAQQFFKRAPGTQFIDNFDDLKEPFATRNSWEPFFMDFADASRFAFTMVNGAFKIESLTRPQLGQVAIFSPGGGPVVSDFCASVDILEWASSQESALGFAGRTQGSPTALSNAYLGSLRMNRSASTGQLWFFNGESDVRASDVFGISPDSDYRFQFSAIGSRLNLRVFRIAKPPTLVAEGALQDSRFSSGRVALWVNTRGSANYSRIVDNFIVTGTNP
ncbi:MAG: hypothetical protein AB9869_02400 [Verrucomicrobiia bacterium]